MNSSIQDSFNLGWKLALVEKGLSPKDILTTYNSERLPVIAKMLELTTKLLKKTVNEKADGEDASAWKRGGELFQLGINYRWSEIVIDERTKQDNWVINPYGNEGDPLQAGDRAPEAPKLKDLRSATTDDADVETSFFRIFSPAQHTALIFTNDPSRAAPVLDALDRYASGTVSSVLVLPKTVAAPLTVGKAGHVLKDTKGHAYEAYAVSEDGLTVVIVRPDGVIGAVALGAEGVERYRQLVFS